MKAKYRKIIIVGQQCTNKRKIAEMLESADVYVGRTFISAEDCGEFYTCHAMQYDTDTIKKIFELNAYRYYAENTATKEYFIEGLDSSEYEKASVLVLTPKQFCQMGGCDNDDVVVWLDDTLSVRRNRHFESNCQYDFYEEEKYERDGVEEFVDMSGDIENLLYFSNDDYMRVFAVIYTLIKHPDLTDLYKICYN